jgi:hypothetical protein
MTVSILSLKPAAQPAGVAGLSVRDFKPTDLQVGGCLVHDLPPLGMKQGTSGNSSHPALISIWRGLAASDLGRCRQS